jgi:hypothetical protein
VTIWAEVEQAASRITKLLLFALLTDLVHILVTEELDSIKTGPKLAHLGIRHQHLADCLPEYTRLPQGQLIDIVLEIRNETSAAPINMSTAQVPSS